LNHVFSQAMWKKQPLLSFCWFFIGVCSLLTNYLTFIYKKRTPYPLFSYKKRDASLESIDCTPSHDGAIVIFPCIQFFFFSFPHQKKKKMLLSILLHACPCHILDTREVMTCRWHGPSNFYSSITLSHAYIKRN